MAKANKWNSTKANKWNSTKAKKWGARGAVLLAVLWLSCLVHVVNYDGSEVPGSSYCYDDYYSVFRASAWGGMISNSLTISPVWQGKTELSQIEIPLENHRWFIYLGLPRGYRMTEWTYK